MTPTTPKATTWKEALAGELPPSVAGEIDVYETQMELRRQGKIDEKVFAESRLRRGVYGQRYDNGQRQDGVGTQTLDYPSGELTKGPDTLWDAPGMQRIKIPFGEVTARQLEVLGELAEEYADGICHVTTRQDFQLHFVHIDDTPELMRRLARVGITTREACGNSVRNVTGCPISGVCTDESFDVTPFAKALTAFLLGHPDVQDFGRKFKISFSGCSQHACGLANIHDLGFLARTRRVDGRVERGFELWVGGGLGAVPHGAKPFADFVPAAEILPVTQAICRVFARLGEKRNRAKARLKFLVAKLGLEEFRRLVAEERETLPRDPRWTELLPAAEGGAEAFAEPSFTEPSAGDSGYAAGPFVEAFDAWRARREGPTREAAPIPDGPHPEGFARWAETNARPQRQDGYFAVTLRLPLGDLTAPQMRRLAELSRRFNGGVVRTTVEQNLLLRWIGGGDVPALYRELAPLGLAQPGAGTVVDVTSCPGTDTCKLGIASSRGLAAELSRRLATRGVELDRAIQGLRIKVSGCFNSCGQHHVADLGFYGVSRKAGNHTVPHFQVLLGGRWRENGGSYGLAVGAVPSKRIPEVVDRLARFYLEGRDGDESFQDFVRRVGKGAVKAELQDLTPIPAYADDPSFYTDWSDAREYTIDDMGVGECAGEVVSLVDFGLAASERIAFEAQLALDSGAVADAGGKAYRAMLEAAKALLRAEDPDLADDPETIVGEFRRRFHDTRRFHDRYAGGKFANYLFQAHDEGQNGGAANGGAATGDAATGDAATGDAATGDAATGDAGHFVEEEARRRIEEAQLFIEAAHACNTRLAQGA